MDALPTGPLLSNTPWTLLSRPAELVCSKELGLPPPKLVVLITFPKQLLLQGALFPHLSIARELGS